MYCVVVIQYVLLRSLFQHVESCLVLIVFVLCAVNVVVFNVGNTTSVTPELNIALAQSHILKTTETRISKAALDVNNTITTKQ